MVFDVSLSEDVLLSFQIEAGAVRGRLTRLGPALDSILSAHGYPQPVASLLAETLALACALAGMLKFDGVFALQMQGDGPVSLVVADVTSGGDLRGYARWDAARLSEGLAGVSLLGKGQLAFTVDQGADTERYQGIVALEGDSLAACVRDYFTRSEQLETAFRVAARPPSGDHGWQAAVAMAQRMPLGPNSPILTGEEALDGWRRAVILLDSLTDAELLDPNLAPARLAFRLYHAEGLEVFTERPIRANCRCSPERVAATLRSFPRDEIGGMRAPDGRVVVTCEFCRAEYGFDDAALDRLYNALDKD
ncbi:MAG: Hsp33 family molecular chaperone HslO [Alphaproteobacteria bacterium]|nr:Hsp33 family molecular chaperone HslO [Alphaproteobacteria bacterium]